jgi:hypothetical protein
MEGSGLGIMDGETTVGRALRPVRDTPQSRPHRATAGAGGHCETLRAELIATAVEVLGQRSHPRLGRTR